MICCGPCRTTKDEVAPLIHSETKLALTGSRRYQTLKVIQKTIFGHIETATDLTTGRVVIQKISCTRSSSVSTHENPAAEAEILKHLTPCAHIVTFLDEYTNPVYSSMVLEYVKGPDLLTFVSDSPFTLGSPLILRV